MGTRKTTAAKVTAAEIISAGKWPHDWNRDCPYCKKDCGRVAMVDLIYRQEPCSCPHAPYTHLVETLYHEACFRRADKATKPSSDPITKSAGGYMSVDPAAAVGRNRDELEQIKEFIVASDPSDTE